eukprot:2926424-Amphidinium_carterae.2
MGGLLSKQLDCCASAKMKSLWQHLPCTNIDEVERPLSLLRLFAMSIITRFSHFGKTLHIRASVDAP